MKRRGGFSPSSLEEIRSAQDRKKELTARLLRSRPASPPSPKDSGEKEALPQPHATAETLAVTMGLRLRADDAGVEIQPI